MQILATPYEDSICEVWDTLKDASPDLFTYAEKTVSRVEPDDGSVMFRLRAVAFETRDDATRFCGLLKQRDQSCFVVKRGSG